jgi:hypothetical protein
MNRFAWAECVVMLAEEYGVDPVLESWYESLMGY